MSPDINEFISELAKLVALFRISVQTEKTKYENELAKFQEESSAYVRLMEFKKLLKAADKQLRDSAVELYLENGNKKVAPGIGIRENKKFIYDPKEAFDWAKDRGVALTLNKKAFESYIVEGEDISFAKIEEVPSATISKDLSYYLEEKEEKEEKEE